MFDSILPQFNFLFSETQTTKDPLTEIYDAIYADIEEVYNTHEHKWEDHDTPTKTEHKPRAKTRTKDTETSQQVSKAEASARIQHLKGNLQQLAKRLKQIRDIVLEVPYKPTTPLNKEQIKNTAKFLQQQKQIAKDISLSVANLGESVLTEAVQELSSSTQDLTQALREFTPLINDNPSKIDDDSSTEHIKKISSKIEKLESRLKAWHTPRPEIKKNFVKIFDAIKRGPKIESLSSPSTNQKSLQKHFRKIQQIVKQEFQEIRKMSEMLEHSGEENSVKAKQLLDMRISEFTECIGLIKEQIEVAQAGIPKKDSVAFERFQNEIHNYESTYKVQTISKDTDSGQERRK